MLKDSTLKYYKGYIDRMARYQSEPVEKINTGLMKKNMTSKKDSGTDLDTALQKMFDMIVEGNIKLREMKDI